jgi:hypothetical protein
MISFWISVVPPKIDWTRLSRRSSHSCRRAADWCSRRSRRAPSGQREPRRPRGAIWAAITHQGIVSPRGNSPVRGVAPTTTPNQRPRMSQPSMRTSTPELITAQLPQVLVMHDASDSSQMRSCSREPPRGNQHLSRGKDAHHDSMGTCGAR